MELNLLIFIFSLASFVILLWMIYSMRSSNNSSKELDKAKNEIIEKVLEKLSHNQQTQNEIINQNYINFNLKLVELETKLKNHFNEQSQTQKLEFVELKEQNQLSLSNIQNTVQDRLKHSISDLVDLNSKNFDNLQKQMQLQLNLLLNTNQERLNQINLDVQKRLDDNFSQNLKSFQEVTQSLGHIQATAAKMIDSTKSIDKLNNIFARTSSKAFGTFGESYLETLLKENLHTSSWAKQVKLPNTSDQIDFVINLDNKKIGIDCKFPVTKYQDVLEAETENDKKEKLKEFYKTVMLMASEISRKYLKSQHLDLLVLYMPSDSMFNEIANHSPTLDYLQKLNVNISGPSLIFPLIKLIQLYEFRLKVNHSAETIIHSLSNIRKNVESFREEFKKLGDKIRLAQENYDKADKNLIGVERNILLLEKEDEPKLL